jgi:hypothetical protein
LTPETTQFGLALWATDVFRMADFMVAVAGGIPEQRHPGFAVVRLGPVAVQIHDDESYRGHPWFDALTREGLARGIGAEIRVQVADVQRAFSEALKRGAQSIAQPFEIEGTLEGQVMGPDGYLFSLWQVWKSSTST